MVVKLFLIDELFQANGATILIVFHIFISFKKELQSLQSCPP